MQKLPVSLGIHTALPLHKTTGHKHPRWRRILPHLKDHFLDAFQFLKADLLPHGRFFQQTWCLVRHSV